MEVFCRQHVLKLNYRLLNLQKNITTLTSAGRWPMVWPST